MSMSNQDKPEVLKDHLQTLSYKKANSAMKADGDHSKKSLKTLYLKIKEKN